MNRDNKAPVPGIIRSGPGGWESRGKADGNAQGPAPKWAKFRSGKSNPLFRAGVVLGLGLGGFFDGIVFHQILGWHHMVCATATCRPTSIEHLQRQNQQDGFFHLAAWILTLAGVMLLFRAGREPGRAGSGRVLLGAILAGGGSFNFFEGLINHQLLGLHQVRPGVPDQLLFDMLFLASGLLLMGVGGMMGTSRIPSAAGPPPSGIKESL